MYGEGHLAGSAVNSFAMTSGRLLPEALGDYYTSELKWKGHIYPLAKLYWRWQDGKAWRLRIRQQLGLLLISP